jgi:hypothetical protein
MNMLHHKFHFGAYGLCNLCKVAVSGLKLVTTLVMSEDLVHMVTSDPVYSEKK